MRDLIKNSMFLAHTTAKEPIKIVSKFASKSSCGLDNIPKKAIKQIMPHVTNPLSIIFKICLSQGIFPNLQKIACVIPIFKNRDINDQKNYHPISLLPNFFKILEQLINAKLLSFLKKHEILHPSQHGFCSNQSTTTAIFEVLNSVTSALNKNKYCLYYLWIYLKLLTWF